MLLNYRPNHRRPSLGCSVAVWTPPDCVANTWTHAFAFQTFLTPSELLDSYAQSNMIKQWPVQSPVGEQRNSVLKTRLISW
jgi:hypothetical protein